MNRPAESPKKNRILVAIDSSPHGRAALEAAAGLAAASSAELCGLFVEDLNLLRLAALPFAHEIDFASATSRPLRSGAIERSLRNAAEAVRRALADVAEPLNVRWTFRVTRGLVLQETLAAAAEADVLVIGRESAFREFVTAAPTHKSRAQGGPVFVAFSGDEIADGTLETAAAIAEQTSRPLHVLVLAKEEKDASQLRQQCTAQLGKFQLQADITVLPPQRLQAIAELARQRQPSLLVLHRASSIFDGGLLLRAMERNLDCPIAVLC